MSEKETSALEMVVARRNRQAAKIETLMERIYIEREKLTELDRKVEEAHAKAPTALIRFGSPEGWTVEGAR